MTDWNRSVEEPKEKEFKIQLWKAKEEEVFLNDEISFNDINKL